jgi:hypothetical protein
MHSKVEGKIMERVINPTEAEREKEKGKRKERRRERICEPSKTKTNLDDKIQIYWQLYSMLIG